MGLNTALLLSALLVLSLHTVQSCYYAKFTPDHTMCKLPKESCKVLLRSVSDEDKKLILDTHNMFRNRVATGQEDRAGGLPTAANMAELVWDDELAKIAQRHAEQCEFSHDCNNCRRVDRFSVGQNLQSGSSTANYKDAGWENMVTKFYEEVQHFDKENIEPFVASSQTNAYGHFSQVVWATTQKIGCGWVSYKKARGNFKFSKLLTCNYGPAGNMVNGEMYEVGEPCSSCPDGTCCGESCEDLGIETQFDGLCIFFNSTDSEEAVPS